MSCLIERRLASRRGKEGGREMVQEEAGAALVLPHPTPAQCTPCHPPPHKTQPSN